MNSKLFKVAIALTFGISAGAFATDSVIHSDGFDYSDGADITTCSNSSGSWQAGEEDESTVVVSGGEAYLNLNTQGSTLTNLLASGAANDVNAALAGGDSIFFESSVKFVPSDSLMSQDIGGSDAKFAIYAIAEDDSSPMKLVVYHKYLGDVVAYTNEVFDAVTLSRNDYTTVRVEYKNHPDVGLPVFSVAINGGDPVESQAPAGMNSGVEGVEPIWMLAAISDDDSSDAEIKSVCFQGTGAVDSIAVGTIEQAVEPTTFTVTFDANGHGTAPAAQTVNDGETATEPEALSETGWTFGGWTLNGVAYDFTTPVTADITLVAVWTEEVPEGVEADDGNGNTFTVLAATVEALEALNIEPLATVPGTTITYAQADALGLLDLTTGDVEDVPDATIEITENGVEVTMGEGAKAGYTVTAYLLSKASITAQWPEIAAAVASGPYGTKLVDDSADAASKFYKVVVTIK